MKTTVRCKLLRILLLPIFLLAGCSLDFALPTNETMHLSVYQSGRPVSQWDLNAADPIAEAVNRWLAANPEGWEYGFITRAPQIYLTGSGFSVNVLKNEVTVKYCRAFYNCHLWIKADSSLFPVLQKIALAR